MEAQHGTNGCGETRNMNYYYIDAWFPVGRTSPRKIPMVDVVESKDEASLDIANGRCDEKSV